MQKNKTMTDGFYSYGNCTFSICSILYIQKIKIIEPFNYDLL